MGASVWNPGQSTTITGPYIDPTAYPYLADPTGVNDSYAALQAAITVAQSTHVPMCLPGKFKISQGLVISSPITILGFGYNITEETGSVIVATHTSGAAIEFNNAEGSFDDGLQLSNFMVKGTATGTTVGFQIEGAVWPNTQFIGLTAKLMGGAGFFFNDCISANVENCRAQTNGASGYLVARSNAIRFRGCSSESNVNHGWHFTTSGIPGERVAPSLVQCLSEENGEDAIYIDQYIGISISSSYLQCASLVNADRAAVRLNNSSAIKVSNCQIIGNVAWPLFSGINCVQSTLCEIIGNNFIGGFTSTRDFVEDSLSGRNLLIGNSGNGPQGSAGFTSTSATGSVFHSQTGSGGAYGQEWFAGYHDFKTTSGASIAKFHPSTGVSLAQSGGKFGVLGATPIVRQAVNAAATDPATTQALVNNIRTILINFGFVV